MSELERVKTHMDEVHGGKTDECEEGCKIFPLKREYLAALGLFRPQVKERKSKKQIKKQHDDYISYRVK